MADKQLAYDARQKTELFDEGDPLAELARIVGFEPRVAANTVAEPVRQEPAFDLEDELMREFEGYDSPRPSVVDEPVHQFTQDFTPAEPLAPQDHAADEAVLKLAPADIEPEPVAVSSWGEPDVSTVAEWVSPSPEPVSNGAHDLIEELQLSIGASQPVQPAPKAPQWSAASIRLPLANFHPAKREESQPAVAAEPVQVQAPVLPSVEAHVAPEALEELAALDVAQDFQPAAAGFPAEIDRHEDILPEPQVAEATVVDLKAEAIHADPVPHDAGFDLAAAAKDGFVASDAALTEAMLDSAPVKLDLDDLLADVSRYPVPQRAAEPVTQDVPVEPSQAWQPKAAEPVAAAPVPTAPVAAAPRVQADEEDPFAGHDFELDLEGIELELADLDFAQPAKAELAPAPVVAAVAAPAPVFAARPIAPAPVAEPVSRPVSYSAPVFTPAPQAAQSVKASEPEMLEELPFDPSMIGDADSHPEAVEMHVPALPPVEQHAPAAPASDFDFDVDAEIATLFEPVKAKEQTPAAAPSWAAPASVSVTKSPAPAASTLDDLERALEEDLRRSMREPVQRAEHVAEVHIQSAGAAEDMNRARSMKRMLAAAAIVLVFAGGAYGLYTVVADTGLGGGSGEPRVITADKEPVKVVPENPGGKTVPNQDKAVYDRVAGATETPKQTALVSSDEEPVDVVQRTLTPEVAPDDNDSDVPDRAMSTPVDDTQDPRLLPGVDQPETASDSGDADRTPAVSPRKVRTMIVKPDGTLVAREETAPADEPVVNQVKTTTIKPNGSAANFPASNEVASADIRATPVETTPAPPAQAPVSQSVLAKAAASDPVNVEPPVRQVQSTPVQEPVGAKPADAAPIPSARPAAAQPPKQAAAQQPKPPAAQQPKPAEVAAVEPAATQPQAAAPSGGYGMQIASLPSEAEANKSYASLSKKFAGVLAGRSFEIRKAEIAGKGTFYRVRIPAGSKDEAAALCEKYRGAGGSCLISK
jgi:hypothetical protein